MIVIHLDYSTGDELSYEEGLKKGDDFATHVLDFFSFDTPVDEVIVLRKNGEYIKRNELIGSSYYTNKDIRKAHNIRKMLVDGSFKFKEDYVGESK